MICPTCDRDPCPTPSFCNACKKSDATNGGDWRADFNRRSNEALRERAERERIDELARKQHLDYDRERKKAAADLKVRTKTLDDEVERRRETIKVDEAPTLYPHWAVKPCTELVDGDYLLRALVDEIRRYVFMTEEQAVAVALWVVLTWLHDREDFVTHSPILFVTSAEKDSGKTTLLKVVSFLVRCGLPNVSISGPALFRSIEKWTPCFIIDEADTTLVDNNDLRAVINSGWTRGDGVIRCDPDSREPMLYSTFAPKAVGMKGRKLPDTTLSRCIVIAMRPRRPNDEAELTEDFNHLDNEAFAQLRNQLTKWASDKAAALAKSKPEVPPGFHNRRRSNWQPLFAIAELAGAEWKKAAWKAAQAVEAIHDTFDPSLGIQVLADIRDAFMGLRSDRATSAALIAELISDEGKPWATLNRGKPITQNRLAGLLRDFHIKPRTIRTAAGDTAKGYLLDWFEDAFERHLGAREQKTNSQTVTPSQPNDINELEQKQTVTADPFVTVENGANPLENSNCDGVTVERLDSGIPNDFDAVNEGLAEREVWPKGHRPPGLLAGDGGGAATVWIRSITPPAIPSGADDDVYDIDPRWQQ